MKKYLLLLVLGLCAISGLAVALLGGEKEQPIVESVSWNYVDMRSVCYMSVECVTTDFSPVQESIYTNRLMYGELPMSFLLVVETAQPLKESVEKITCMVECAGVKLEADLKDVKVEKRDGKSICSGVFVKDLSPVAKELGEPAVMGMMKLFPKDVKISIKHQCTGEAVSEYVEVKQ